MKKNKDSKESGRNINGSSNSIKAITSGLIAFIVISLILSVILTLITMYTETSNNTIHILYITILLVASLLGGFFTGRKCSHKGMLHGLFLGIILCVIAFIYTSICGDISVCDAAVKSIIIIAASSLGGVIGVK